MKPPSDDCTRTADGTGRLRGLRPPWRPGQTGNPRGGAVLLLSLAARIRRASGDGQELLDFHLAVMRGEPIPVPGRRVPLVPTFDNRMHAAAWLADRGWGKAKELVELTGDATTTVEQRLAILRRLSEDERAQLRALLAKALASPDSGAGGDFEPTGPHPVAKLDRAPGAPQDHGRPRNVGRASAPVLLVDADQDEDTPPELGT
jgi:hypothetical protein